MYNITFISTFHTEIGKCDSDELYKIIESINPEVIFEESSSNYFYMFYNTNPPNLPLEVKCMKKYLQSYNIKHIPVDIDLRYMSDNEHDWMLNAFEKYDVYKNLVYEQYSLTEQYGFDYLNSDKCLNLHEQQKIIEKNIMEIEKNELLRIYKLFCKENDIRENAMLHNIYNYSKENQYNQAVFLLGCAHRKSIMQKIIEYEKMSEIKLNWTMYSNKQKTCL